MGGHHADCPPGNRQYGASVLSNPESPAGEGKAHLSTRSPRPHPFWIGEFLWINPKSIKNWLLLKFARGRNLSPSLGCAFAISGLSHAFSSHFRNVPTGCDTVSPPHSIVEWRPSFHVNQAQDRYLQRDRALNRSASQISWASGVDRSWGRCVGSWKQSSSEPPRISSPLPWRALVWGQAGGLPFATPPIFFVFFHLHRFEPVKHQPALFL